MPIPTRSQSIRAPVSKARENAKQIEGLKKASADQTQSQKIPSYQPGSASLLPQPRATGLPSLQRAASGHARTRSAVITPAGISGVLRQSQQTATASENGGDATGRSTFTHKPSTHARSHSTVLASQPQGPTSKPLVRSRLQLADHNPRPRLGAQSAAKVVSSTSTYVPDATSSSLDELDVELLQLSLVHAGANERCHSYVSSAVAQLGVREQQLRQGDVEVMLLEQQQQEAVNASNLISRVTSDEAAMRQSIRDISQSMQILDKITATDGQYSVAVTRFYKWQTSVQTFHNAMSKRLTVPTPCSTLDPPWFENVELLEDQLNVCQEAFQSHCTKTEGHSALNKILADHRVLVNAMLEELTLCKKVYATFMLYHEQHLVQVLDKIVSDTETDQSRASKYVREPTWASLDQMSRKSGHT